MNSNSLFDSLIKPAVLMLLSETEGLYRSEREFHHHYTICHNALNPLNLGTRHKSARMEDPAGACYGSGRKGNMDYFVLNSSHHAAMEFNYNYTELEKISKDFKKLIDPQNAYTESVYFAYGTKRGWFKAIEAGREDAVQYFVDRDPEFHLPLGLNILVVEHDLCSASLSLRHGRVTTDVPSRVEWNITSMTKTKYETDESALNQKSRERTWLYWVEQNMRGRFAAFVNQQHSCSKRLFDASDGIALGKPEILKGTRYQEAYRGFFNAGVVVSVQKQPSLDKECRRCLPDHVLAELQRQIPPRTTE